MKKLLKKLNCRRGFSLAEVLITVLILIMVSGVVAAGIPAAQHAFVNAVDKANAQVLLSTAMTALRDELGSAVDIRDDVTLVDGSTDKYTCFRNVRSGLNEALTSTDKGIVLQFLNGDGSPATKQDSTLWNYYLVSTAAETPNIVVLYKDITYSPSENCFTVTGLRVERTLNGETIILAGAAQETDPNYSIHIRALNQ